MRSYMLVTLLIVGLMGAYFALLPLAGWSGADSGVTGVGPG